MTETWGVPNSAGWVIKPEARSQVVLFRHSACPTFCGSMDYSMPGFPVLHYLLNLLKLMSSKSMMLSNHLILCCPLLILPSIFPWLVSFLMIWLFTSGGQDIGVSVLASVPSMDIQGWFPLGFTAWNSLLSKGL